MSAKYHMNWASSAVWRWHPPDRRVPSSASVWYSEPSSRWRRDLVEPDRPALGVEPAHHQRQVGLAVPGGGGLALAVDLVHARHLVVVLAARHEIRAHDRARCRRSPTRAGRHGRRRSACRCPRPASGGSGGASAPVVATDESSKPDRVLGAPGGRRIGADRRTSRRRARCRASPPCGVRRRRRRRARSPSGTTSPRPPRWR